MLTQSGEKRRWDTCESSVHFTDVDEKGDHGDTDGQVLVREEFFPNDTRTFAASGHGLDVQIGKCHFRGRGIIR